jgi:hypothetical protein
MLIALKAGNRSMGIVGHVELLGTSIVAAMLVSVLRAHDHASCANQTKSQFARTIFNYTLANATDRGDGAQKITSAIIASRLVVCVQPSSNWNRLFCKPKMRTRKSLAQTDIAFIHFLWQFWH